MLKTSLAYLGPSLGPLSLALPALSASLLRRPVGCLWDRRTQHASSEALYQQREQPSDEQSTFSSALEEAPDMAQPGIAPAPRTAPGGLRSATMCRLTGLCARTNVNIVNTNMRCPTCLLDHLKVQEPLTLFPAVPVDRTVRLFHHHGEHGLKIDLNTTIASWEVAGAILVASRSPPQGRYGRPADPTAAGTSGGAASAMYGTGLSSYGGFRSYTALSTAPNKHAALLPAPCNAIGLSSLGPRVRGETLWRTLSTVPDGGPMPSGSANNSATAAASDDDSGGCVARPMDAACTGRSRTAAGSLPQELAVAKAPCTGSPREAEAAFSSATASSATASTAEQVVAAHDVTAAGLARSWLGRTQGRLKGISRKFFFRTLNKRVVRQMARRATIGFPIIGFFFVSRLMVRDLARLRAEAAAGRRMIAGLFSVALACDAVDMASQALIIAGLAHANFSLGPGVAGALLAAADQATVAMAVVSFSAGVTGEFLTVLREEREAAAAAGGEVLKGVATRGLGLGAPGGEVLGLEDEARGGAGASGSGATQEEVRR